MECQKHPGQQMNEVCGEPVCGSCFGEQLMTEPYAKNLRKQPTGFIDMTQGLFGTDEHYEPKPGLVVNGRPWSEQTSK